MIAFANGRDIFVGTQEGGILRFQNGTWQLEYRPQTPKPITCLFQLGANLWAGGEAGFAAIRQESGSWRSVTLPGAAADVGTLVGGAIAANGKQLLALREGWLLAFNGGELTVEGAIGGRHIFGIASWHGKIVISTDKGAYHYTGDDVVLMKQLSTCGLTATQDYIHFLYAGSKQPAERVYVSHHVQGGWWYARF